MHNSIKESDWKVFRELKDIALERFCQRVLTEVIAATSKPGQTFHERYLAVFQLIKDRDEDLAIAFDGASRSNAILQLAKIQYHQLLTAEEMARFSEETRNCVSGILGAARK